LISTELGLGFFLKKNFFFYLLCLLLIPRAPIYY
jgi:hypothetical protein